MDFYVTTAFLTIKFRDIKCLICEVKKTEPYFQIKYMN